MVLLLYTAILKHFIIAITSGQAPQVASSAVQMSARANKERKKKKKKKKRKNIERDSNSGRRTHRQ